MDAGKAIERLAARAATVARGPSKLTTLERAVREHVTAGTHLHLSSGLSRPQASCYEVLRRYAGRRPNLTLSCMSLTGPNSLMVHWGLVRDVTCTFHGESYPTPGPNPLLQQAFADGRMRLSAWSILSFTQRLLAGALRLPFLPTNSLRGSSLADGNPDVIDVDGSLAVRPLVPDVAFVHAPAADEYGNVLLAAPFGDECLGAWAATRGAIVTAERIVPHEVIAAHPAHLRLPGALVLAVAHAPFGAHPGPLFAGGLEDVVEPYAEDGEFYVEFRRACRDEAEIQAWAKDWILGLDHAGYLARLGAGRLHALRGRADLDSWREIALTQSDRILRPDPPTPAELAAIGGARALAARVKTSSLQTVLAGVGVSNLAAWLARCALAAQGVPVDLMVELGLFGYAPPIGDPYLVTNRVVKSTSSLGGVLDILGLGLAGTRSAGIIGAGEVDRLGNVNSSRAAGGKLLVGSGGANDVASICREVVIVVEQSRRRFVDQVAFVTAPGDRVVAVATQLGLYEKDPASGELVLAAVWGEPEAGVRAARAECGWELRVAKRLRRLPAPTADELRLARAYDPEGRYLG